MVNLKTGGVLKSMVTAGIVRAMSTACERGASQDRTEVACDPVGVYVEGVAITEYQLLRLRDAKDGREFRTVTGGVMHVSGGATRDLVPFESKKTAPRTYEIVLPNLGSGDYGLLPPAGGDSTSSSGPSARSTLSVLSSKSSENKIEPKVATLPIGLSLIGIVRLPRPLEPCAVSAWTPRDRARVPYKGRRRA